MDRNRSGSTTRFGLGGPLLNIYQNDLFMFLEETEICNYADDTTIYACGPKIENVIMHKRMMPE